MLTSDDQRVVFASPRKPWRWLVVCLFGLSSVLLGVMSADLFEAGAAAVVLVPVWIVSLFGVLVAMLGWFVQVRQGGSGAVAWMDADGVHIKGGQGISWGEVESVFTRRAPAGDLVLCIRPADVDGFVARAPRERREAMRANLDAYGAPLFINLSAFWHGTVAELSSKIAAMTSERIAFAADDRG